ncbi:MAG TPA: indole-3-glycerol phosphate synthase TrpC [Solirubrobacterales bacterium]|jgi:indole-3-glycerol phosphate synthase|nr:indole-3-glycerol phosphate synthase TrpC [Solirubrobacterales bacterium]
MSRLDQLVDAARDGVRRRIAEVPGEQLRARLGTRRGHRPFKEALVQPGLSVIAEFKRGSPSAGAIRPDADVADFVGAYERGGAAAISVLTDEPHFHGSLADLEAARAASALPILRKDFVVDPYQLWEASLAGADAVLLIAAALAEEDLQLLWDEATAIDLDCLVEVHDEADLERALRLDPDVIGINNRNLADLSVDTGTTPELITDVPAGITVVAESGYDDPTQVEELERIGVDAVLIGEALMRAADPEGAVRALVSDEEKTREHLFSDER